MRQLIISLVLVLLPVAGRAECDPGNGKQVFDNKCGICHLVDVSAGHGVGPNLHGVVDRPIGKADGFGYSAALAASQAVWTREALSEFLKAPQKAIPGTAMPFQGLKSESERQRLVCYLLSLR
ncbi:c-type cytochrome [Zoogloea dura]|jgi:cytochrome c|uniref:C-type cytochrome n=1 Tax=Zoogloea dura TaxID=2728840 RepID=A0A848G8M1_9RHOO|nr:c-type cytochrome [Zoogloea dura]NML25921.1 c-type cytochrome [Zoogloea dura]